jgi:cytochrome c peroxidase
MIKQGCVLLLLLAVGCHNAQVSTLSDEPCKINEPVGFPLVEYPADNAPTKLRIELGRRLFYDNRLSDNQTLNCGSCHVLSAAFTDGRTTSPGSHGQEGLRNAPTLANVAWMKRFMMEGGVPTLETQALAPLHDSVEMGINMMRAVERLNGDPLVVELGRAAYGRDSIDPFVITRALACFQRTFMSGDSRYDRFVQGKKDQMKEQELRGMSIFFSEQTHCSECHSGVFFTDMDYHNIGLEEEYADEGKARATHREEDVGRFKTPTLRNIQLTAPYMHDGRMASLEEVIAFYNTGGNFHRNKDERVHPLGLTDEQQADLLAFLTTLTDWNFVQNKDLLPLMQ